MSTRIQGSAAQSVPPPDTSDAEVEQSRTAAAASTAAAKAKAQEESGQLDSIEHAGAREGAEDAADAPGHGEGPALPAHLFHLTGGKGGHQALEKKAQEEAKAKKEAEREAAKEELKARETEGQTPHYETEGSAGNAIRDRNWVSHSTTLEHTHYESGKAPARSKEAKATSHRQPAPKAEVGAKLAEFEIGSFDESVKTLASGKHGSLTLLELQGHAGAQIQAGDGALKLQGQLGAAAYLVNARVHGEHKGTVDYSGAAYLNAGAHAQAQGEVAIDIANLTLGAKGGMEAFAGVTAGVTGKVGAGGVEAGGEARVEAGLGFEANGAVELKDGKFELQADLGVCVGVGADVKFNVEIDAREIAKEASQAGQYLERKEQELAGAVEQAALEGVASAASHAFSFFQKASAVAHAVETGVEVLAEVAGRSE